jgi:hypothetical protein
MICSMHMLNNHVYRCADAMRCTGRYTYTPARPDRKDPINMLCRSHEASTSPPSSPRPLGVALLAVTPAPALWRSRHCSLLTVRSLTELLRSQPFASKTKPPQVQRYDDAVAGGAKRIACATRLSYALYPAWPDGGRTR